MGYGSQDFAFFRGEKHVRSKRPKSGFARTKAILMTLMLIVQSNRSGRSYFGCLRNPYGGEGTSVHILSTKLILYTFNTRSRLNYFKYIYNKYIYEVLGQCMHSFV